MGTKATHHLPRANPPLPHERRPVLAVVGDSFLHCALVRSQACAPPNVRRVTGSQPHHGDGVWWWRAKKGRGRKVGRPSQIGKLGVRLVWDGHEQTGVDFGSKPNKEPASSVFSPGRAEDVAALGPAAAALSSTLASARPAISSRSSSSPNQFS